jgi:hypothetical protein
MAYTVFTSVTADIAQHYLPAIINDDYTGLDDGDAAQLLAWLDQATDDYIDADGNAWVFAHFSVPADAASASASASASSFTRDEVTGLHADCVRIEVLFTAKAHVGN